MLLSLIRNLLVAFTQVMASQIWSEEMPVWNLIADFSDGVESESIGDFLPR